MEHGEECASGRPLPLTTYHFCFSLSPLEVVTDPDRETRLAEPGAAALVGEDDVLPFAVEERAPRPVEMDREAERERLEAEAVRGAAVDQLEPLDVLDGTEHRPDREAGRV